jgi:histidinol-phosphate aminotransferase
MAATPQLSRRAFARLLGLGGGAALAAPLVASTVARGFEERLALAAEAPAYPAKRLPKDPNNLILLNSNENAYGPSPAAREAMVEGFEVACRYPDFYIDHLQARLAEYHGVDPDEVVVTAGSTELLKMCAYAFLGRGKRLVQASPTFEALARNARMVDAEVIKIPLDKDYGHDLEAMAEAAQARPGLVYLCNPNNPTGTVMSRAAIERFLQRIPQESVVLVDEAYHHYVEDPGYGTLLDAVKAGKKVVVARTFSKIYGMAGLRIGYGIAPRALTRRLRPHWVWSSANVLGCVAAAASLEDEEFAGLNARRNRDARKFIVEAMRSRGHSVIPSHTNFICIDVLQAVRPVIAAFREQGIRVGRPFTGLPQHIRLSLGLPEELEKFVKAFDLVLPSKPAN